MQLRSGDRRLLSVTPPWPAGGKQGHGDALVEVHAVGWLSPASGQHHLPTCQGIQRDFSPLREAPPVCCLLQASPFFLFLG